MGFTIKLTADPPSDKESVAVRSHARFKNPQLVTKPNSIEKVPNADKEVNEKSLVEKKCKNFAVNVTESQHEKVDKFSPPRDEPV